MSKANGGKVESCNRIKDRNGKLVLREDEVRFGKIIFRNFIIKIPKSRLHACLALMVFRDNYFRGELNRSTEVEISMRELKNGKAAAKDEVTGEMIQGRGDILVGWFWKLCNMAFEGGGVPED